MTRLMPLCLVLSLSTLVACGDKDDGTAEGDCASPSTWYLDFDGDGFGGEDFTLESCDQPEGYLAEAGDCDDADATAFPGGTEVCDDADNDCNGVIDDDSASDAQTFYVDADGDGFGSDAFTACSTSEGSVEVAGDCDDSDPDVHPDGIERCNGVDDDCDGEVDFDTSIPGTYADVASAVEAAPDGAHICVSGGTYEVQNIDLYSDITFDGVEGEEVVFDGGGADNMFWDEDWRGPNLGLMNLHITNLKTSDYHSALYYGGAGAEVVLEDVEISEIDFSNYYVYGGLIYLDYGGGAALHNVDVHDIRQDHSSSYGYIYGLLAYTYGNLVVDGLTVEDVSVEGSPWGLLFYNEAGDVDIRDVDISGVQVDGYSSMGGMLIYNYSYGGDTLIEDVAIHDNTVSWGEDAMNVASGTSYGYVYGLLGYFEDYGSGDTVISGVSVTDNKVTATGSLGIYGGLAYTYYGSFEFSNVLFADNTFSGGSGWINGGLIQSSYSENLLTNIDMANNTFDGMTTVYGGLLYDEEYADFDVMNLSMVGNDFAEAEGDGSIWYSEEEEGYEGGLVWEYNNVYGNTFAAELSEFSRDGEDADGFSHMNEDPGYMGSGDYHLADGSPLIDAGSPDVLDEDGSVSDIGAYGGPGGSW